MTQHLKVMLHRAGLLRLITGRREPAPQSCPGKATCALWHIYPLPASTDTHARAHTEVVGRESFRNTLHWLQV